MDLQRESCQRKGLRAHLTRRRKSLLVSLRTRTPIIQIELYVPRHILSLGASLIRQLPSVIIPVGTYKIGCPPPKMPSL